MNILLINYGTSNINSIYNSLKKIKKIKIFINNFNIKKYDKIIFPGQGHINLCMKFINKIKNIENYINNSYILGICIGYHIFCKNSEEDINSNCLNLINEKVKKICKNCCKDSYIPNIGWSNIELLKNHKIFKNISNNFKQYFMHSYSSIYNKQENIFGISNFNNIIYNSIIIKENKFLFQFHPEKSGIVGLKILKNFLEL